MSIQNESNLLLTESGYPNKPIECNSEWQANAQQAAMQMPAYAIGPSSVASAMPLAVNIKTWRDRYHAWESDDVKICMQAEIDELRAALSAKTATICWHCNQPIHPLDDGHAARCASVKASSKKPLTELPPEIEAALDEAAKTGARCAELPNGSIMFINRGEQLEIDDDLNCPHCGGSGHKGDVAQPDWQGCLRISELPSVHECIDNFANDRTEDNAVGMVQAIIAATSAQAVSVGSEVSHISMSQVGVGDAAESYVRGWNDCVDAMKGAAA